MYKEMCKSRWLLLIAPALLAGCGGSGSQGVESESRQNVYSGVVVDGHLQGATVFADINRNGTYDSGEPYSVTDAGGNYLLKTAPDVYNPPVIADVPDHAIDGDTGKPVGQGYRLTAPDGQYGLISPLTTMVRATLDNYPGMSVEQAEEAVRAMFGLTEGYDLHADYTLKTRPSTTTLSQWAKFIAESGRAHNIGRLAALRFGQYVSQAKAAYGGALPLEKEGAIHSALASRVAIEVAPFAAGLPNKELIDPTQIALATVSMTREEFESPVRLRTRLTPASLGSAAQKSPLHVVPMRNTQSNFVHWRMADGGASAASGKAIIGTSTVILPDLSETETLGMKTIDGTAPLSGDLLFDSDYSAESLRESGKVLLIRLAHMPVEGEPQSVLFNRGWLRNPAATWPSGAAAYRMLIKTTSSLILTQNDATTYRTGTLPAALLSCCGSASTTPLALGDLQLRFADPIDVVLGEQSGPSSSIALSAMVDGVSKPLDSKGTWAMAARYDMSTYFLMQIPSSYRSYLKGMDQDGLFSRFGLPIDIAFMQLPNNQYGHAWVVQGGRYAETVALNDAAFNALKANLKW